MTQRLLSLFVDSVTRIKDNDDMEARFLVYTSAVVVAALVLYLGFADVRSTL